MSISRIMDILTGSHRTYFICLQLCIVVITFHNGKGVQKDIRATVVLVLKSYLCGALF
jgi:hypothetical protein